MIEDDDIPVGRVLSRRDALRLIAAGGAGAVIGCKGGSASSVADSRSVGAQVASAAGSGVPGCVAKPELTVGPYFLDKQLERSDIRIDPTSGAVKEGAPLRLAFNVSRIANGQCTPLPGAAVDIWQCDALGAYSGVDDNMVGFNTVGQKFLRGFQVSDANGVARFTTVYPGWYQGRAVHIHFKIRTPASAVAANQADQVYEFTSQLFFDESLTDRVHARAPYAAKGQRDLRNENDGIYKQSGGVLLLNVASAGNEYDARFDIGLDLSDTNVGKSDGMGRGGPGGRGRPPAGRLINSQPTIDTGPRRSP
jgi:protocatechuate 3,4-dioxygenase beta subunit